MINSLKTGYICGPLTELAPEIQAETKKLYSFLGDVFETMTGVRAFVPHEWFDPILHGHFTPREVDAAERHQVCTLTSVLLVVAVEPTWGGGIEVEMANTHKVPVIIMKPKKRISRLLLGNPAVAKVIDYEETYAAVEGLRSALIELGLAPSSHLTVERLGQQANS